MASVTMKVTVDLFPETIAYLKAMGEETSLRRKSGLTGPVTMKEVAQGIYVEFCDMLGGEFQDHDEMSVSCELVEFKE